MFAQLLASAPSHDHGARPTIISGAVHIALIALAVQATRTIATTPASHSVQSNEVYLAPQVVMPPSATPAASAAASSAVTPAPVNFPAATALDFDGALPEVTLPSGRSGYDLTVTAVQHAPIVPPRPSPDDAPWRFREVDEPVSDQRVPKPVYPAVLAHSGIVGEVWLRYVVGADGRVETGSIVVLQSTRPEFGVAAADAIRQARFSPARRRGVAVRQLVEQKIRFKANDG